MDQRVIALGKHLRHCDIELLGVSLNLEDYTYQDQELIRRSEVVCHPSRLYEMLFLALGKKVFPANFYDFLGNKIKQTLLFEYLEIPHPRTRIYYGRNVMSRILEDFTFPFVAKNPLGSSQGREVFLISSREHLSAYLCSYRPAYIQEYLPVDKDLRVVLLAGEIVHAYWRIGRKGDFRNNISLGGSICFEDIPEEALNFAKKVVSLCGFGDVGLDIIVHEGLCYVLEANMVYGLEGFKKAGKSLEGIIKRAFEEGWLLNMNTSDG